MNIKPLGANQTELITNHGHRILYSYETPVAGYLPNIGWFRTTEQYSKTTTKHINSYLKDKTNVLNMNQAAIEHIFKDL